MLWAEVRDAANLPGYTASRIEATSGGGVKRWIVEATCRRRPISELQRRRPPPYRILRIGLTMERAALYQRIDQRIDRMIERGLVEEVRRLVEHGYGYDLPAMSGLGYRQIGCHLRGEISLEEAIRLIKRNTRRFVRQQYNWFRLDDEGIRWFQALDDPFERIKGVILPFLDYRAK